MATIPKDCCGTDIPVLCIVSLKRQGLSDDILREATVVASLPSSTPNSVREWEHKPVLGTDVLMREVTPSEEKMTYKKNALHKVIRAVPVRVITRGVDDE